MQRRLISFKASVRRVDGTVVCIIIARDEADGCTDDIWLPGWPGAARGQIVTITVTTKD